MEDRLTMIRQQMELTKESFGQKLAELEKQVSEQVESAGTAVNATTEAVQEVVHSIGNVFDINRHFRRHPWLFIGGSMALGYAATQILRSRDSGTTACQPREVRIEVDGDTNRHSEQVRPTSQLNPSTNTDPAAAHLAHEQSVIATELRRAATVVISGLAQELATRSLPYLIDLFRSSAFQETTAKTSSEEPNQTSRVSSPHHD